MLSSLFLQLLAQGGTNTPGPGCPGSVPVVLGCPSGNPGDAPEIHRDDDGGGGHRDDDEGGHRGDDDDNGPRDDDDGQRNSDDDDGHG